MTAISIRSTPYQLYPAGFWGSLNTMAEHTQRLVQVIGGVFSTMHFAQVMQNKPAASSLSMTNQFTFLDSGLSVCRVVCDFFQVASLDLCYETAAEDTTVALNTGTVKHLKKGQLMVEAEGKAIRYPWYCILASIGSIIERVLAALVFFHGRMFTLSCSALRNISIVGFVISPLTALAFLGIAILDGYHHVKGKVSSIEKTVYHIVDVVRNFFDTSWVVFDLATYHLASTPALGIASSVISTLGGALWLISSACFYKYTW